MSAKAWIFDVDGTLSDTSTRQKHLECNPRDWTAWNDAMGNDGYHWDIIDMVSCGILFGMRILVCTGREEKYRKLTTKWLDEVNILPDMMYMRKDGDHRHDDVMKQEMLDQMRVDGYDPVMVFEDRTRVVKMWRKNGIRCLQVTNGDF